MCCLLSQPFFHTKLAQHIESDQLQSIIASKRQLTYFLSYMARAAAFWDSCQMLRFNVYEIHLGSVLFEQMIMRSLDLCNKELRGNWRKFPHQFLILLNGNMELLSSYGAKGFESSDGADGPVFRRGKRGALIPSPAGAPLVYALAPGWLIV